MHAHPLYEFYTENSQGVHKNFIDNHTDHKVTKVQTRQLDNLYITAPKGWFTLCLYPPDWYFQHQAALLALPISLL
jgi:hypothetical protein